VPRTPPRPKGGLRMLRGLMIGMKKNSSFKKIYLNYKITKHVESLPKMDKSITFH